MKADFSVKCSKCDTLYNVREVGTRQPWIDKEEYHCPVCGEPGGEIRTHYSLDTSIASSGETHEDCATAEQPKLSQQ